MEKRYVEVIVDVAHSSVDKIFDYELPGNLAAQEGSRILVPFGRMQVEGIVLAVKENTELPPKKIRAVQRVIDEQPIVGSEQILLAKYMCVKYHTTMAFCLRLMYPAKMRGERIRPKTVRMAAILDEEKAVEEQAKCYTKEGVVRAKNRLRTIETLRAGKTPLHFSMLPLCGICEKKASSRCARSRSSALPMGAWKQKQKYRLKCGSKARYFGNKLRGRGWGKKNISAPRRHGQRQNRSLYCLRQAGAGMRKVRHRPGAGNFTDAPNARGICPAFPGKSQCFIAAFRMASASTSGAACGKERRISF